MHSRCRSFVRLVSTGSREPEPPAGASLPVAVAPKHQASRRGLAGCTADSTAALFSRACFVPVAMFNRPWVGPIGSRARSGERSERTLDAVETVPTILWRRRASDKIVGHRHRLFLYDCCRRQVRPTNWATAKPCRSKI